MKSKYWKLLAVFLSIGIVAAACGSDDDGGSTTTTAAPTTAAPTTQVEVVQDGSLLDTVKARGTLNCGVSGSAVAFSETQPDGSVTGIDADFCRAVAAAVTGSADNVEFSALTASERFTAVQTGDVDVLMRNTTWTQSRDSSVGMDFGPTTYYDGQQLMARVSDGFSGSSQVADIDGAVVCTNVGTTTEKNIAEAALLADAEITLLGFETSDEVYETFISGGCDITTTDGSALVGRKAKQQPDDQEWVIFPATPISKEPLGPTYGQNDSAWADAVNWTVYAMIIMPLRRRGRAPDRYGSARRRLLPGDPAGWKLRRGLRPQPEPGRPVPRGQRQRRMVGRWPDLLPAGPLSERTDAIDDPGVRGHKLPDPGIVRVTGTLTPRVLSPPASPE